MKKTILFALVAALCSWPLAAQESAVSRFVLFDAWDMDGEAADDNQLITAGNGVIASATEYFSSISAQPDVCRLLALTISDTDMGATEGAITVTGTGCLGEARVCSWSAWTAGDDDGVKALTCTDGQGAYFADVTSILTGTMTAAATDEYFLLGYTVGAQKSWRMWGKMLAPGPLGELRVDPTAWFEVGQKVTTSAAYSTTLTSVNTDGPFTNVAVGDLLSLTVRDAYGRNATYERIVTARASANSITLSDGVLIPAAGINFKFKKAYTSTNPDDLLLIPVGGWKAAAITWSVDANADTGGIVTSLQCTPETGPEFPTNRWVVVDTTTTATGSTAADTVEAIDLSLAPFQFCRFSMAFGALTTDGDDADSANEDLNASVVLSK